jgi:uncharacterized delta-60 repeat protein
VTAPGKRPGTDHLGRFPTYADIAAIDVTIPGGNRTLPKFNLALARYHPDGSPDTTFGNQGSVVLAQQHSSGEAVTVENNGDILVAGGITVEKGSNGVYLFRNQFLLACYLPSGSLDPNFQGNGTVITDFGHDSTAGSVFLQGDKIIVVGGAHFFGGSRFDMAAYYLNGDLDPSFGLGGKLVSFGDDETAEGAAMQPDNKIVVVGNIDLPAAPGSNNSQSWFLVARYTTGYPANQQTIDQGTDSNSCSPSCYVGDLLGGYVGTVQSPKIGALSAVSPAWVPALHANPDIHGVNTLALVLAKNAKSKLAKSLNPIHDLVFTPSLEGRYV